MRLVAFCEAPADFRLVSGLVDRVLREFGPTWVADNFESPEVCGFPDPERETWVLAGFEPCNDAEQQLLDELHREWVMEDPRSPGAAPAMVGRSALERS